MSNHMFGFELETLFDLVHALHVHLSIHPPVRAVLHPVVLCGVKRPRNCRCLVEEAIVGLTCLKCLNFTFMLCPWLREGTQTSLIRHDPPTFECLPDHHESTEE